MQCSAPFHSVFFNMACSGKMDHLCALDIFCIYI